MENPEKSGGWALCYRGLVKGENWLGHLFLLIIRLYWGWLLIVTGFGKWAHASGVADFFGSLGLPFPLFLAYFVGTFELLGGVSLFLGLFARLFTIPLVIIFFTAYATAHHQALVSLFQNPSLFTSQEPFLYLYTTLVVLFFGSGVFSFDFWLERKNYGKAL